MNFYYAFYCRAYDWYNTNGKKSKDTLRGSAIVLISALPCLLILIGMGFISILQRHTPLNKWVTVLITLGLIIGNWILIPMEKSDALREEYAGLSEASKKKINFLFYLILLLILFGMIAMMISIGYYKKQYGNYDL